MKNSAQKKNNRQSPSSENSNIQKLIEKRAYEIWETEGVNHGYELDHWLRAEQEITGTGKGQSQASATT